MKNFSLRVKLIFTFLLVGITPLLISTIVVLSKSSDEVMHEAIEMANIINEGKAQKISDYFDKEVKTIEDLATLSSTKLALKDFSEQFEKLERLSDSKEQPAWAKEYRDAITKYYNSSFLDAYSEKSNGQKMDVSEVVSKLDLAAVAAQYDFIVTNEHPLGQKDALVTPKQKSIYAELHAKIHPELREVLVRHGLYDIFLVNKNGRVVYTVFKEVDFATSLSNGPWAQSGLAAAFEGSKKIKKGEAHMEDFAPYAPSYEAPASFIATPLYENGEFIGSIIVQLPLDKITAAVSSRLGLGELGESILLGSDGKLRSDSHRNAKTHTVAASFAKGSNLKLDSEALHSVLKGESGYKRNISYDGVETLASYQPIEILNLKWYVITEFAESEVLAGLNHLITFSLTLLVIFSIITGLVGIWYGSSIGKRINSIVEILKRSSQEVSGASSQSASSATELSEASTEQAASLQETMASIEEISAMVGQNAESATKVMSSVEMNREASEEGSKSVVEMMKSIDEIKTTNDEILGQMEASNKEFGNIVQIISEIGEKTKVINDIVFQTKLLSFNASVEAARAGEHGKGFAVVAEEVGNLAQMSGNAAKEITDMLTGSIKKVNEIVEGTRTKVDQLVDVGRDKITMGQSIAQKCRDTLTKIAESAQTVSTMVSEITHASKEQSQGVQEINKAISQLDQVTQQNSAVAQQSSTQAEQLNHEAQNLATAVNSLATLVNGHGEEVKEKTSSSVSNVVAIGKKIKSLKEPSLKKASGEASVETRNSPKYEDF
jgi:methyl-accepting chemotaxis protein